MSIDWTHQFCLACDKQTDGTTYCSESCHLADYESTSTPGSEPNSPAMAPATYEWSLSKSSTGGSRLYLSPSFNFSTPQLFASGATQQTSTSRGFEPSPSLSAAVLSPSNSYSSLCSMKSTSSTSTEAGQLSSKASMELRAYARSFDAARPQRRKPTPY